MKTNKSGIELLKSYEMFVSFAYDDAIYPPKPAKESDIIKGILTIGYGFTKGVKVGDRIDLDAAEKRLKEELVDYEDCINESVHRDLTENQFSACVVFAFNIGRKAFQGSTLCAKLNLHESIKECATWFLPWNKVTKKVNGKAVKVESKGLTRRRRAEQELFLRG